MRGLRVWNFTRIRRRISGYFFNLYSNEADAKIMSEELPERESMEVDVVIVGGG